MPSRKPPQLPPSSSPKQDRLPTHDELQVWNVVTERDKRLPNADIDWQKVTKEVEEDTPDEAGHHMPKASYEQIESLLMATPVFTEAGAAHTPTRTEGGLDRNSARRLRQGKFPIEATLDLHGMTREEAWNTLVGFLQRGFEQQRRCVLVITGKGRFRSEYGNSDGVLRNHLPKWLAQPPCVGWVLRHARAQPHHGGEGAFYILLRRKR